MKIQELMERVGILETGRTVAYVKDALIEMNMIAETHVTTARININQNQRYYDFPNNMVKITDIRVKNHLNSKDEYRSIPRMMYEPNIEDADQELT